MWNQVEKSREKALQIKQVLRYYFEPYPWQERRGLQIHRYALSKGVLLRPLGNVIYFMPPYVITPGELTLMFDLAWEAMIHVTTHWNLRYSKWKTKVYYF